MNQSHSAFMHRALELAARGKGSVSPNPCVGCVIVKNGKIVGEGFHQKFGGPHAEVIALQKAGMKLAQMDLVEVNEAFAAQTLAVQKELGIDPARLNVSGGAIAVGHPLAASGTRILHSLLLELRRRGQRYGLGSACIGGGQGIAIVVEAYPGDSK
jgi:hypothetical protein